MYDPKTAFAEFIESSAPPPAHLAVAVPHGEGAGEPSAMVGGYDGASQFDRSMAMWSPPLRSADADMLPDKPMADARSRDIGRNDSYILGGVRLHQDNVVGSQFILNSKPNTVVLGMDDVWAQEFQEEVEAKFMLWAESPDNWPDASRMNTLTGLVRLAVGIYTLSGEVLAAAEWIKDGRPFSTAVQMIDLDRLSNKDGMPDTPTLRSGVQKDRYGAPVAYHIRNAHPFDRTATTMDNFTWKVVPARKPWGRLQMIHIVEQMRPAQTRGVSDMVSALKEIHATRKFRDITLQNAVVNATYAAAIESDLPSETVFSQLGGGQDDMAKAITSYATAYMGAISKYAGNSRNLQLDGVRIPHLFPGTKFKLQSAGTPGGVGTAFEQSLLRYIASSLGVSYEQLSRDYTNTNYSSARASMNETWKYMQSRKKLVADRFATIVFRLWLEEALNKGLVTSMPRNAPSWYEGQNADAYSQCDWIGASKGQIDELKETEAAVLRIQNNLSTIEEENARLGKDYRKTLVQREREVREMRDRGIEPVVKGATQASPQTSQTDTSASALDISSEFV